jgi:hydrogenase expression/formation protein HypE
MSSSDNFGLSCPLPFEDYPTVLMAHGGGGKLMNQLIDKMFLTAFDNPALRERGDSACLKSSGKRLAFTTDSYVVSPLFFPGGDIGSLAVYGTVNDLAVSGARPVYLSAGFILEEGLPMETLWRVVQSISNAARQTGVEIVTGDTKVIDKGKGDGVYINTSGIGIMEHNLEIGAGKITPGDILLVNGDIGRHGMAIMAAREELGFESAIESDCAPLAEIVLNLIDAGVEIRCMRDLTRGGLAGALNELAASGSVTIEIDESQIPVRREVQALSELLGIDPLHSANEGRLVLFVPEDDANKARKIMQKHIVGEETAIIGHVSGRGDAMVTLKSRIGAKRILSMLSGEQLPRIC